MINRLFPTIVIGLFLVLSLGGCQNSPDEQMRHIVVFNFKSSITEDQKNQITEALAALQDKIPGITAFEHGINESPEGLNPEFTHVYQFTFEDAAARDAYLPHPEHKKFGEMLGEMDVVEGAFVVDYLPQE